jgi:hypothetical protein
MQAPAGSRAEMNQTAAAPTQQASSASASEPPPPAVPPVPRLLTTPARRRSWNEGPVRVLVILTVLTAVIAAYLTAVRVRESLRDRRLINEGLSVNATIVSANGSTVAKRWPRNESMPVSLSFTTPDGVEHSLDVRLDAKPDAFARVGDHLLIKVDPADPQLWTEQTQAKPWAIEMVTSAMLIGLTVVLVALTMVRRQQVLRVWRDAPLMRGRVVEVKHTAVAPRSRSVRFSLDEADDRRIRSLLVPTAKAQIRVGETIWVVCDPGRSGIVLLPGLYAS